VPLTKFKRPNGYWYLRGTIRGQPVYESARTRDEADAEIARKNREDELLEQARHGLKATVTFERAADDYVEKGGDDRYLLRVRKKDHVALGLVEHFKGVKLIEITQIELDHAAKTLFPKATAETRNRQVYTPFIAVWNHAVANRWATPQVWRRPRVKKGTATRNGPSRSGTVPVSYEKAWEFVSVMSPAAAAVMTVLFYTGMRPIEVFSLVAEDVSIRDRWITLGSSKTGEARGIPIHEALVPLLSPLVDRGGVLLRTHKNAPYPLSEGGGGQLKTAINGARERSGIRNVSPYTARHTVSTQLVVAGVHPHLKDQILGHAVTDMSRRYTHVPQQPLIEAINKLPVIEAWREAEWMADPVRFQRRLARSKKEGSEE
jgi:integrase/recombinase XerD